MISLASPACFAVAGLVGLLAAVAPLAVSQEAAGSPAPPHPTSLLPANIGGYAPGEADGVYTHDTLFQLIDGGAEVYRSLNVRLVVSRRYMKAGAPDIIVDVFDMGSSSDAFGAYHHDLRENGDAGIGHESEYEEGALYFWKDRFFVSILALDETAATKRAVLALGRAIAGGIPRRGARPEILRLLPREDRPAAQVSYFHDWTYLNTRHFIAAENLLGLGPDTEGILARFRFDDRAAGRGEWAPCLLLLARYPSVDRAVKALAGFLAGHLRGAAPGHAVRRDDGTWAAAWRADDVIIAVLDARDAAEIERLAAAMGKARDQEEGRQ